VVLYAYRNISLFRGCGSVRLEAVVLYDYINISLFRSCGSVCLYKYFSI